MHTCTHMYTISQLPKIILHYFVHLNPNNVLSANLCVCVLICSRYPLNPLKQNKNKLEVGSVLDLPLCCVCTELYSMLGIVNKEHFHPHREVKKPKGSEKQVSKEGDGEPSPKKARVEEPETTTVKKVYFPTPALFLTWEQPLLCILHPTPPHPPFLSLLSCTNQSFKIHHTIICYFKHSF